MGGCWGRGECSLEERKEARKGRRKGQREEGDRERVRGERKKERKHLNSSEDSSHCHTSGLYAVSVNMNYTHKCSSFPFSVYMCLLR